VGSRSESQFTGGNGPLNCSRFLGQASTYIGGRRGAGNGGTEPKREEKGWHTKSYVTELSTKRRETDGVIELKGKG